MALTDLLSAIGDAIREKTHKSAKLKLSEMPDAIKGIDTGIAKDDLNLFLSKRDASTPSVEEQWATFRVLRDWAKEATAIPANGLFGKGLHYFDSSTNQTLTIQFPKLETIDVNGMSECYYRGGFPTPAVSFPSLKTINNGGLKNNYLSELNIPNVETMAPYALSSIRELSKLNLPKLKQLNQTELNSCSELSLVDCGSLESINSTYYFYAPFSSCPKLETLILRGNKVATLADKNGLCGEVTSEKIPENGYGYAPIKDGIDKGFIYVPKALLEDYKVATNWSVFADKFRAIEDYPEICGGAK